MESCEGCGCERLNNMLSAWLATKRRDLLHNFGDRKKGLFPFT